MKRRGLLGWMGGGAAAALVPADPVPPAPLTMPVSAIGQCSDVGMSNWSKADAEALTLLRRKMDRVDRIAAEQAHAREAMMRLCGGHAPHVATCQSWAPWFKAQATTRWRLAEEKRQVAEQRERSRSLAGMFSRTVVEALPDWVRMNLQDDEP